MPYDRTSLQGPEGVIVEVCLEIGKMVEVKPKVVDSHPDHGQAPKNID
jgi:hypothetical protein